MRTCHVTGGLQETLAFSFICVQPAFFHSYATNFQRVSASFAWWNACKSQTSPLLGELNHIVNSSTNFLVFHVMKSLVSTSTSSNIFHGSIPSKIIQNPMKHLELGRWSPPGLRGEARAAGPRRRCAAAAALALEAWQGRRCVEWWARNAQGGMMLHFLLGGLGHVLLNHPWLIFFR